MDRQALPRDEPQEAAVQQGVHDIGGEVMNERIRELMNQTGVPTSIPFDQWCEKFAELIVQECVNVLHDNELWNRHISHALKEHFGVEE